MLSKTKLFWCLPGVFALALCGVGHSQQDRLGPDPKELQAVLDKAHNYLKTKQNADGSFAPKLAGPGVSALVVAALVKNGVTTKDPLVASTLAYLEKQVKADGGIYNKGLANYTTSVAIVAFQEANTNGKFDTIIKNASKFIKAIQHGEKGVAFGGYGYDDKSRPDASNTNFSIDALIAAGVPKDDPAIQRALTFLGRCQNLPGEYNDQKFAEKAAKDDIGGLTYTPIDPDDSRHKTANGGLRSLGAMTYGGLKSFLYAGVSKDDPRVKAAISWIRHHYTLEENPGEGQAGLFYYYHTFAKAMQAWGEDRFADHKNVKHDWRRELFDALKSRQQADGSWRNAADKTFGESTPELATAFAMLSLSYCRVTK